MRVSAIVVLVALGLGSMAMSGCEKTDHSTIDKWKGTEKGEGKLLKAFGDSSLDADLSAHAAANLLLIGKESEVREAFQGTSMTAERKSAVLAKLVPRLWPVARIEGELAIPSASQVQAKDLMFAVRRYADPATQTVIDGYLTDWYTSGYYEGRAKSGAYLGAVVMRSLGAKAAPAIIAAANAIVAKPPTGPDGNTRAKIGDQLLLALAAVATPESVKYVLDVVGMTDRADETLATRAMDALYQTFVDPAGLFDVAAPDSLAPNLPQLVAIAKDSNYPARVTNHAVTLIRMVGKPACVQPLIEMVSYPNRDQRFRYVGANNAIKCGGASAVVLVGMALPDTDRYDHEELGGAVWAEAARAEPRAEAQSALRELLGNSSWVARWIAIEGLGLMKSSDDKGAILKLANDKTKLSGYWGSDTLKIEPTLGSRAAEIAAGL